jgi:hypothetical protein
MPVIGCEALVGLWELVAKLRVAPASRPEGGAPPMGGRSRRGPPAYDRAIPTPAAPVGAATGAESPPGGRAERAGGTPVGRDGVAEPGGTR